MSKRAESFLTENELATLQRAFLLGLNRQPMALPTNMAAFLKVPEGDAQTGGLRALALASQQFRFQMPAEPPPNATTPSWSAAADPVPVLPDEPRRFLRRLVGMRASHGRALLFSAALDRLAQAGFRLHPFDLPHYESELKANDDRLRGSERAYLRAAAAQPYAVGVSLSDAPIDAQNWRDYPKKERMSFLNSLIARDRTQARALVQDRFNEEPANIRAELLEVFTKALDADDRSFIELALKDRSREVREIAQAALSRLRGSEAFQKRLSELMALISVKKEGLLRRELILGWKKPQFARNISLSSALRVYFKGFILTDILNPLGIEAQNLSDFSFSDDLLLGGIILAALEEGRGDLIPGLVARSPDGDRFFLLTVAENYIRPLLPNERLALIQPFLDTGGVKFDDYGHALEALYDILRMPLPTNFASELLAKPAWMEWLAKYEQSEKGRMNGGFLPALARLLSAGASQTFMSAIRHLPQDAAREAVIFTEFQTSLARCNASVS